MNFNDRKKGAVITIVVTTRMTNITTKRETVNGRKALPLTVIVKNTRRSWRTVLLPVVIKSSVAVTVKSKRNPRKVMDWTVFCSVTYHRNKHAVLPTFWGKVKFPKYVCMCMVITYSRVTTG